MGCRKFLPGLLLALGLLVPSVVFAQTTLVSGTVTDPNGVPYGGGTVTMNCVGGCSTVTITSQAQCTAAGAGSAPCNLPFPGTVGPARLDATGSFTITLYSNTSINPGGSQWAFTVGLSPGILPPLGTGPQSYTVNITVTGATQSVSSTLSAAAPSLIVAGFSPGGSTAFNKITSGTNTTATMVVSSGASLAPSGSGSVTSNFLTPAGTSGDCMDWGSGGAPGDAGAACNLFSALLGGTNTTAAMVVGTGASLSPTGTGSITANKATPAGTVGDCMSWAAGGTFGDPGNPCNAGSYSTVIDSVNFVTRVGGQVMDASYTNTSGVISFPNNDCPTNAIVGDIDFGTNVPTTFAGNGTVPVGQGTITAACTGGLATGSITVSVAATANCTPSGTVACDFFWGPDESTPLTNFWNAVVNSACNTGVLRTGVYLVQSGQFNANATNLGQCNQTQSTSYIGPSLQGVARSTATIITPTPNFVTTTGAGQSCGGGVDHRGCFFSSAALFVQGVGIWGGGQPRSADTNAFSIADFNGGTVQANVYARDVQIAGWAAQAKNSWGVETNSASGAYLFNITDNAAGGIACVGDEPSAGYTALNNGTCGNGLGLTQNSGATNLGCLENIGNGIWFSNQVIYGTVVGPGATSAWCIVASGGGAIYSNEDQIEGVSSSSGPGFPVVVTAGKIYLDHDILTDSGSVTTATDGIFETGGAAYLHDTQLVIGSVTGDKAIDNHLGGGVIDQGGNVFTTNAGMGNITWGGIAGVNTPTAGCTGTATSSATLFLQSPFGLAALPNCTNATANIVWMAPASGSIQGMFLSATHAGVSASSGVVTLFKNGSSTAATCTFGTTTRCSYDGAASPIAFSTGDVFTIQYTTQAAEVLAGLNAQLWLQAQ